MNALIIAFEAPRLIVLSFTGSAGGAGGNPSADGSGGSGNHAQTMGLGATRLIVRAPAAVGAVVSGGGNGLTGVP